MRIVGLTGGIACGKTIASQYFASLGVPIIDTDRIARHLVEPGSPVLEEIKSQFPTSIILKDGSLDRKRLRQLIFADESKRLLLEDILHPAIREQSYEQIRQLEADYIILVVPLLLETRYPYKVDRVLCIEADKAIRIKRLIARDAISIKDAKAMLVSQATDDQRRQLADDIVQNNDSISQFHEQLMRLHLKYSDLSQL